MAELEGFICPLCKADCRTFLQLEAHFSEEHEETTRSKLRANIKNFLGKARTLGRKKAMDVGVEEGAAAVSTRDRGGAELVTNVSGIDPDYWTPQEFGELRLVVLYRQCLVCVSYMYSALLVVWEHVLHVPV